MWGWKRWLGAALLCLMAGGASGEPEIGAVSQEDFTGATGERTGLTQSESLFFNRTVYAEERVETGAEGNTKLRFLDGTSLTVGSKSTLVLDKFVYDPQTGAGEAAISFGKGVFRFVTGQIRTKEAVTLRTPTATIAIRGTHLILTVHADGSAELAVVDGGVLVRPCGTGAPVAANAVSTVHIAANCDTPSTEVGYKEPSDPAIAGGGKRRSKGGSQKGDDDRRGKSGQSCRGKCP
jgi:hypothetical protein